ncbi:MAG TPA: hypothetical protein PLU78_04690, partial [Chitinophagales bacterium]|nr:hypothetical protein [Chitinophagales bacterium]
MLDLFQKGLSKLFGSKSNRDIKSVTPIIQQINAHFDTYQSLSDDALRAKTTEFKTRIQQYLSAIDEQITQLNAQAEQEDLGLE